MLQSGNVGIAPSPHWKRRAQQSPSPTKGTQPRTRSSVTAGQRAVLTISVAFLALGLTCLLVSIYVKQQRLTSSLQLLVTTQGNWTAAVVESSLHNRRLVDSTNRLVQLLHNRKLAARWRKERRKWRDRVEMASGLPGSVRPSKKHRKNKHKGGRRIPWPESSGRHKHRKKSKHKSDKKNPDHTAGCVQNGKRCHSDVTENATTIELASVTTDGTDSSVQTKTTSTFTVSTVEMSPKQVGDVEGRVLEKKYSIHKHTQTTSATKNSLQEVDMDTTPPSSVPDENPQIVRPTKNDTLAEEITTAATSDEKTVPEEITTNATFSVSTVAEKRILRRKTRKGQQSGLDV